MRFQSRSSRIAGIWLTVALQKAAIVVTLASILAAAAPVQAGFTLVTDASSLGANDAVDLSGLALGPVTTLPLPLSTIGGASLQFNHLERFSVRSSQTSVVLVNGSHALRAEAFMNRAVGTDLFFNFAQPVEGFGADVQAPAALGNIQEIGIAALASDGSPLANFDLYLNNVSGAGFSGFGGILSDQADIFGIQITQLVGNALGEAVFSRTDVSQPLVRTGPTVSGVPEPASLTLLGIGGLGLFGYRWRRRRP